MAYEPPRGDLVGLDFLGEDEYQPPPGNLVALEFDPGEDPGPGNTQYTFPVGFDPGGTGLPRIWRARDFIDLTGRGIAQTAYGSPSIYNRDKYVAVPGWVSQGFSNSNRVEHYRRFLSPNPIAAPGIGTARFTLSKRFLTPPSIFTNFPSNHTVGGTRQVYPAGFDAARFGTRIIPEGQAVYPLGFSGAFGSASVENLRQILHPAGFATGGAQPADRWGQVYVWNLRQYITQYPQEDSGLNPPPWPQWTAIANRNREIGVVGFLSGRHGNTEIFNNARPIAAPSIPEPSNPPGYRPGLVAFRIRHLPIEGIESPYLSNWTAVVNDARLTRPQGFNAQQFGMAALANTRRYRQLVGWDSAMVNYPMITYAVRGIEIGGLHVIAPPPVPMPDVRLHTRYADPFGTDMSRYGAHFFSIHRNILAPRWLYLDEFGEPRARNVTPELRTNGRAFDEFGNTSVRLQWRPVYPGETFTQIIPRPHIGYKDRPLPITPGINSLRMGDKLTVVRTGAPPYTEQIISLRGAVSSTGVEGEGRGIPIPDDQVPEPNMNQSVLYPESEEPMTLWGETRVTSNVIHVAIGYHNIVAVAEPRVELKNRFIRCDTDEYEPIEPPDLGGYIGHRLSPHTIYITEATEQAILNHVRPALPLHVIDGRRAGGAGILFGNARVQNRHRSIGPEGIPWIHDTLNFQRPRPIVVNRRAVLEPPSINAPRAGMPMLNSPREIGFYVPFIATLWGNPDVRYAPPTGDQYITPTGLPEPLLERQLIEYKDRPIYPAGTLMQQMGTRVQNDSPYAWRGLRVGPLMPTIPNGFASDLYGAAFISHRVREIHIAGFDSFVSSYDNFRDRMRVTRRETDTTSRRIITQGHDSAVVGAAQTDVLRQYIRPDGNSDQYRKGAF
jgi:hypothetical protein